MLISDKQINFTPLFCGIFPFVGYIINILRTGVQYIRTSILA